MVKGISLPPLSEKMNRSICTPQLLNASRFILLTDFAKQSDISLKYQQDIQIQDMTLRRTIEPAFIWNKNSTFYIPQNSSPQPQRKSIEKPGSTIDASKRYVLVVEDNKFSLSWVTTMLNAMKIESIIAENGKEAIERF